MNRQQISAFSCHSKGRSNVLVSKVNVSAYKRLFPNAQEKEFTAIWDTGATNTAISEKVAKECGLIATGQVKSNTANGEHIVNTYIIDLKLPNNVVINGVTVSEFTAVGGSDLLIGMDIIGLGDFAISNYEGKTVFSFRIPSIAKTDYVSLLKLMSPAHSEKIDRNVLCPCGSGKKYKHCHGANK